MKKNFAILLSVLIITALSLNVCAAAIDSGDVITPNWSYMNSIDVNIVFSGNNGIAKVDVERYALMTRLLTATLTVYKKVNSNWVYVDSIYGSSTRTLSIDLDFAAESGVTYKAVADVTAYGTSGGSESDTISRTEICP